jgi:hypothetical protein
MFKSYLFAQYVYIFKGPYHLLFVSNQQVSSELSVCQRNQQRVSGISSRVSSKSEVSQQRVSSDSAVSQTQVSNEHVST